MKRLISAGIVSVVLIGALAGCTSNLDAKSVGKAKPEQKKEMPEEKEISAKGVADFQEQRKFVVRNGYIYAVSKSNKMLTKENLGEEIGKVSGLIDVEKGKAELLKQDLIASFAPNGTVYKMKGYSEDFRLVVEDGGEYYLCERVSKVNDEVVNIQDFLDKANYKENIEAGEVYDHFGMKLLKKLSKDDAMKLVDVLSKTKSVKLANDKYEEMAKAQAEGKSYLITIVLKDGTKSDFYVIPELNLGIVGDYVCSTDNLGKEVKSILGELKQTSGIIYN